MVQRNELRKAEKLSQRRMEGEEKTDREREKVFPEEEKLH